MRAQGLSEHKALRIIKMSANSLRYQPVPERHVRLREQIVTLAQRHRRYGSGMIYLKLRHARILINRWRREYNEERPKKGLGGLTPSQYAEKLATKSVTLIAGL